MVICDLNIFQVGELLFTAGWKSGNYATRYLPSNVIVIYTRHYLNIYIYIEISRFYLISICTRHAISNVMHDMRQKIRHIQHQQLIYIYIVYIFIYIFLNKYSVYICTFFIQIANTALHSHSYRKKAQDKIRLILYNYTSVRSFRISLAYEILTTNLTSVQWPNLVRTSILEPHEFRFNFSRQYFSKYLNDNKNV